MRGRIAVTSAFALVVLFAFPPGAHAVGELTSGGCVDDPGGPDVCAQTAAGLLGVSGVAVSPDGRSVYAASFNDDALVRFNRSSTGFLTPAGCIEDNDTGTNGCAQAVNGLDGALGVAVSPDGRSVYVTSNEDDAVVRFNRSSTGDLTPGGCIDDNDSGADVCAQAVNGLDGAKALTVSPDGTSVYAGSAFDNALVRFNRSSTGALTSGGCIDDSSGSDVCAQALNGLGNPTSVAVSPDGTSVYVAAVVDDTLMRFSRSPSGALDPDGCVEDNDSGTGGCTQSVNGLDGAISVAVSADGESVYVASFLDQALVRFNRSPAGAVTPGGCIDDNDTGADVCAQSVNALAFASSVAVSPDGGSVYVASAFDEDALVRFDRSSAGTLTPGGCVDDNDTGLDVCAQSVNGLDSAGFVVVSPDDKSVYVAGSSDSAVVRFNRAV